MYNRVEYTEKVLESGLTVPTKISTLVVLRVESIPDASLGFPGKVKQVGWVEITPKNKAYPTLVLEFEDGYILNMAFGKSVLKEQGFAFDNITEIRIIIR